jgi:hypothetical protein
MPFGRGIVPFGRGIVPFGSGIVPFGSTKWYYAIWKARIPFG